MTSEDADWRQRLRAVLTEVFASGRHHRRRLSDVGVRIAVSGVRGKSTAVRWLHDIFTDRGLDTYAKITGVVPTSLYNGTEHVIERSEIVRLYENERELRWFTPVDVAVVENQGIREYTTRLVNQQFVRPQVIFLTNVRADHLDTLGRNRLHIARSLARAVPEGTHVVSGERDAALREFLTAELDRRNATISHVDVPDEHRDIPGAELAYGLNPVLEAVGEPPLPAEVVEAYLDEMRVSWTSLPSSRVFDAAAANDVQSTELIRRRLAGDDTVVQPLLYLRGDRRGRTATFLSYFEMLAERGLIEQARVVGHGAELFDRRTSFRVVVHDEHEEAPRAVLETALEDPWPLVLMGNTVSEFMSSMTALVEERREQDTEYDGIERVTPE